MEEFFMTERERKIYEAGTAEGKRRFESHLVEQYELGKPVLACDRVWFIKSDIENLHDIFSDIKTTWEEEHGTKWKDEYAKSE